MIIYDLEIINCIPDHTKPALPGYRYCEGWHDHEHMGISVLCAYDYETDRYRVFCEDNFQEFRDLVKRPRLCVGFNNINFDNKVLRANGVEVPEEFSYDILREIWRAAGLDPTRFSPKTHGGYGLDAVCKTNFNMTKTGHGAKAPEQWQRGEVGAVIDYCLEDVRLTKCLLDRIISTGFLLSPKDIRRALIIRLPKIAIECED